MPNSSLRGLLGPSFYSKIGMCYAKFVVSNLRSLTLKKSFSRFSLRSTTPRLDYAKLFKAQVAADSLMTS